MPRIGLKSIFKRARVKLLPLFNRIFAKKCATTVISRCPSEVIGNSKLSNNNISKEQLISLSSLLWEMNVVDLRLRDLMR